MRRIYVKDKAFLKNFVILLIVFVLVATFTILSVYQMALRALQEEIETMSSNTTKELKSRVEDAIDQCNNAASHLVIDDRVQIFFTHKEPEVLIENYHEELSSRMNLYGLSYVDSVYLYAPKYGNTLFRQNMSAITADVYSEEEMLEPERFLDTSWLAMVPEGNRIQTNMALRAKRDRWPYYITLVKRYRSTKIDGVVVINIDLQKLYEYLITDRNENLKLYLVDQEDRVILRSGKKELYQSVEQREELEQYVPKACFANVQISGKEGTAYAQDYSEEYGFTCVTVAPVGDYLVRITQLQYRFLGISGFALVAVILFAAIYSLRMVRPLRELRELLDGAQEGLDNSEESKYTEEIRDIADRIVSHLQTNTSLRKELDARLDLLKDTQMLALQAQINPHFLFNTLNTVSLLLQSDCGDDHPAARMLSELSAVLRYSLSENENVRLGDEVTYIRHYLSVMQYRYEGIETFIDVEELACDCAIPKLILQPLVENSLQHGISACLGRRRGKLDIRIRRRTYIYKSGRELPSVCIEVEDNGIGMGLESLEELRKSVADHSNISRNHIGISNVAQRLYLLFQGEQEFFIESTLGQGTVVRIIFPAINM